MVFNNWRSFGYAQIFNLRSKNLESNIAENSKTWAMKQAVILVLFVLWRKVNILITISWHRDVAWKSTGVSGAYSIFKLELPGIKVQVQDWPIPDSARGACGTEQGEITAAVSRRKIGYSFSFSRTANYTEQSVFPSRCIISSLQAHILCSRLYSGYSQDRINRPVRKCMQ